MRFKFKRDHERNINAAAREEKRAANKRARLNNDQPWRKPNMQEMRIDAITIRIQQLQDKLRNDPYANKEEIEREIQELERILDQFA